MQNESNQKIEALLRLKDQTWERFDSRRRMQWRTNVSIWTVLVAALALIAKGDIEFQCPIINWGVIVVGIILFVFHLNWSIKIADAFSLDLMTSLSFENMILSEMEVHHENDLAKKLEEATKQSVFRKYGHLFEIGVTGLLIACLVLIVWPS